MRPFVCKRLGSWLAVTIDRVSVHGSLSTAFDAALTRTLEMEPTA